MEFIIMCCISTYTNNELFNLQMNRGKNNVLHSREDCETSEMEILLRVEVFECRINLFYVLKL